MIVMQDVTHYLKIKTKFKVKEQLNVKIITIYQDLIKLINLLNALNRAALCQLKRSQKHYRRAEEFVANFQFDSSKFINVLTVFIREKRKTIVDESITIENK